MARNPEILGSAEVLDQMPVGIFITDEAGSCLYVNSRWSELTGCPPEDALGEGGQAFGVALAPTPHDVDAVGGGADREPLGLERAGIEVEGAALRAIAHHHRWCVPRRRLGRG